jgi:ubiquitin carboxyl-terminal hydrolase 10
VSVVYHHGSSATGGHYTVAVSRGEAGKEWLHFDDENVSPVGVEEVVVSEEEEGSGRAGLVGGRERCAYLLFLEKVR